MNLYNIAKSSGSRLYCRVMESWQTYPLVSGVGIQDKRSIMPIPAKPESTGVDHRNIVLQLTAPCRFESYLYSMKIPRISVSPLFSGFFVLGRYSLWLPIVNNYPIEHTESYLAYSKNYSVLRKRLLVSPAAIPTDRNWKIKIVTR